LPNDLISTEWLAAHVADPALRIVDASYKMPGVTPTAIDDYRRAHIPGAIFVDIDAISDPDTYLPHMLPSPQLFAERLGALGLGNEHRIVFYDANGFGGATRLWWMLRAFGHDNVAVLDGGLKKWRAEGRALTTEIPAISPVTFTPDFQPDLVRDRTTILANVASPVAQILDARSAARFEGTAAEPWPGRRQGHIPGSLNLDHLTLVDPTSGTLKPPAELRTLFDAAWVDPSLPVITSCGSGITATVLAFALHQIGHANVSVYDGSWAEWGLPGPLPIETGPSRRN
jgi:thiosulfate/3-mercaptopyruvate sulfurtransferase